MSRQGGRRRRQITSRNEVMTTDLDIYRTAKLLTVLLAGFLPQPRYVGLDIVPAQFDHGPEAAAPVVGPIALAAAAGDAGFPLLEGDLVPADGKGLGDRNRVLRTLLTRCVRVAVGRAHHEVARRDDDHLRACGAVAESLARRNGLSSRRLRRGPLALLGLPFGFLLRVLYLAAAFSPLTIVSNWSTVLH